ncbi:MAG: tRNA (adenine-N1)-methyltransferase [Promethearchaeota archaeon]
MTVIREGDPVLIALDTKRQWLVKAEKDKKLHTHKGIVDFNDIIGSGYGRCVKSNTGTEFMVFYPLMKDFALKVNRKTQIIYPKDAAIIITYAGIGAGSQVLEAGTGSGALAIMLANIVRPSGRVYSYEIKENHIKIAEKNIKKAGLVDYIELKNKDVTQGIDERDIDAVILDLATPWIAIPHAYEALKAGGVLVSYSPTIEQTQKTVYAMRNEFGLITTVECLVRPILVRENMTRPATLIIGHTAYITFARKVVRETLKSH